MPAPSVEKWKRNPERYDIQGVDHFPTPLAKNNFDLNMQIFIAQMEDSYNVDLSKVKWRAHNTRKSFDEAYGRGTRGSVYAFASPIKKEVHFGPTATKAITRGEIKNWNEYYAMNSIAHELAHTVSLFPYHERGRAILPSKTFEEGCAEIVAQRFILNNVQLPRNFRKEVVEGTTHAAYRRGMRKVGMWALLAEDGNPGDAVDWIYDTYLGPDVEKHRKNIEKLRNKVWKLIRPTEREFPQLERTEHQKDLTVRSVLDDERKLRILLDRAGIQIPRVPDTNLEDEYWMLRRGWVRDGKVK
jgi:hypothetical protein